MGVPLDRFCDTLERAGSTGAAVPVVGTLVGVLKAAGGLIQTIAAVACAILLFIPAALMGKVNTLMDNSWAHIKHGLANVLAGTIEAIPIVGTLGYFHRSLIYMSVTNIPYSLLEKYMPYQSLVEDDRRNGRLFQL